MSRRAFASMFSGGGLADIGMMQAGWQPLWGIEYSEPIAGVYRANVDACIMVADVRGVEYRGLPKPDHLQTSPQCKNASVANSGAVETEFDLQCGEAVCRALRALEPETFTLENVYPYRKFRAYRLICDTLTEMGYWWEHHHLNSADYGVPQTRKRLILRATQGGYLAPLPSPVPWIGWYSAVEDILDTLPASRFADWQLMRLPAEFTDTFLHMTSNTQKANPTGTGEYARSSPANTVTSGDGARPRAFLMPLQGEHAEPRGPVEPALTVTANHAAEKQRAFIVKGSAAGLDNPFPLQAIPGDLPVFTQRARQNNPRAFIVDGKPADYAGNLSVTRSASETPTVTASQDKHQFRAWLDQGRVVAMTPRALARFQSCPDTYELPANKKLACTVLGNGVPSLMMQRIAESLTT